MKKKDRIVDITETEHFRITHFQEYQFIGIADILQYSTLPCPITQFRSRGKPNNNKKPKIKRSLELSSLCGKIHGNTDGDLQERWFGILSS